MNLSKKILIRNVSPTLEGMGYTYFRTTSFSGLFVKYLGEGIFLSIVLDISQLYDDMFSANFYIAPHTFVNYHADQITTEFWQNFSSVLTEEEIKSFSPLPIPCRWSGYETDDLELFFKAVSISEGRIISKKTRVLELFNNSRATQELCDLHRRITEEVMTQSLTAVPPNYYSYYSKRKLIPMEWYVASDRVQKNTNYAYYTKWNVVAKAEAAYREYMLMDAESIG